MSSTDGYIGSTGFATAGVAPAVGVPTVPAVDAGVPGFVGSGVVVCGAIGLVVADVTGFVSAMIKITP